MLLRVVCALALASSLPWSLPVAEARRVAPQTAPRIAGVWDSTYGEIKLTQIGTRIRGEYQCCGGGTLDGYITGNVVRFHWREPRGAGEGEGVWQIRPDGTLRGSWGFGQSVDDGATWNLWRRSRDQIAQ